MIEPWQVWNVDLGANGTRPMVVISSETYLQMRQGRSALMLALTKTHATLRNRISTTGPDGTEYWIVTERPYNVDSIHLEGGKPLWTLPEDEIKRVRTVLRLFVDLDV